MSASVEYLSSGIRGANHGLGQTERIVEAFNPYSTSPNIKLLLDLVAQRFELIFRTLYISNEKCNDRQVRTLYVFDINAAMVRFKLCSGTFYIFDEKCCDRHVFFFHIWSNLTYFPKKIQNLNFFVSISWNKSLGNERLSLR